MAEQINAIYRLKSLISRLRGGEKVIEFLIDKELLESTVAIHD